jgi:hypothetical protein
VAPVKGDLLSGDLLQRQLAHPYELLMDNACRGGWWRNAYLPRSTLPMATALGWVR